jgi:SAM-dependent methyltransferase
MRNARSFGPRFPPVRTGFKRRHPHYSKRRDKGDKMVEAPDDRADGTYVLAAGERAAYRLRILHELYGPATRRLLIEAGLRRGMRVADIGCGVGMVTAWLAKLVGPEGTVVGIDDSEAQLSEAREQLNGDGDNVSFHRAGADDVGLPAESFDLVYCRFLLIHLPDPRQALREMRRLLKPNGILACEDGDLTNCGSEPPSALDMFPDLWGRLGPIKRVDFTLGRRLYRMVLEAGFTAPEITFNQPVVARGESKRLLELSVAEAGESFVKAGLITAEELERTLSEMQRMARDENVLAVMPRMSQVWARKQASSTVQPP